jgi:glycerol uptake facilitator-like aquaporin
VNREQPALTKKCLAEFLGTFMLILFGCGAVHASVLTGAQSGLWQVAIVWGVAIMRSLVVFAVTDEHNAGAPPRGLAPAFIGLTVAALISVIAPLTQACFNPARDFGPRLFAFLAGWGPIALPGPRGSGFLTVYIIAPILGAILSSGLYLHVIGPQVPSGAERT